MILRAWKPALDCQLGQPRARDGSQEKGKAGQQIG
jgi:hypothetical protein